jgi:hypothetical protein
LFTNLLFLILFNGRITAYQPDFCLNVRTKNRFIFRKNLQNKQTNADFLESLARFQKKKFDCFIDECKHLKNGNLPLKAAICRNFVKLKQLLEHDTDRCVYFPANRNENKQNLENLQTISSHISKNT